MSKHAPAGTVLTAIVSLLLLATSSAHAARDLHPARAHAGRDAHRRPATGKAEKKRAANRSGAYVEVNSQPAVVLLGDRALEAQSDTLSAGRAEAVRFRALASGLADTIHAYVGRANAASTVIVGLYADANGHPGALLSVGAVIDAVPGSWNAVSIARVSLAAGGVYWLAVLGRGGSLRYRDRSHGSCSSETSPQGTLAALPTAWRTGATRRSCPLSAYVTAEASAPPVGPTAPPTPTGPTPPTSSESPSSLLEPIVPAPPLIVEPPTVELPPVEPPPVEPPPVEPPPVEPPPVEPPPVEPPPVEPPPVEPPPVEPPPVEPPPPPTNTGAPTLSGLAVEGETLKVSNGTWTGSPSSFAYQWQDCNSAGAACANIAGASASSYKLKGSDVGHTVRAIVTAENEAGSSAASSGATALVSAPSSGEALFLSPSGKDSSPCSQAQPCLSMGHAYEKASAGQTVQMLAGSYPSQTIPGTSKAGSAHVLFVPAPGASVTLTGTIYVFGSHVTIEGMSVKDVVTGNYDQSPGRPNPTDVSLLNLTGRNFEIDSATNVTVEGGSWGPASACGGPYGGNNNSIRQTIPAVAPENILINDTIIHDVQSYDLLGCHIEGLAIFAGNHVTVSNSKFYGNSIYDVFIQANSGGKPNNVTLAKNWMAGAVDNSAANGHPKGYGNGIVLGSEISSNLTLAANRFNGVVNINDDGSISSYSNTSVLENFGAMPYSGYPCATALKGVSWSKNVWQNDKCATSDVNLLGLPLPYLKASNDSSLDYTLTGVYAGS
jgi:hypothetical protein